ncbi:tetratricopeptide repeat protein, partial [Brevundimonas sp.]|uniref:tetratricopeptide repeat protein n=1 Tax=Brevundimonas sp. TaxID=1871086 RepID=UPI001A1BD4C2
VWAPAPRDREGRTAYGLYLAGRYLAGRSAEDQAGANVQGAAYLSEVLALTPEQPLIREQAFTAALLSGDLDDAAVAAPSGPGVPAVLGEAGRLVAAVQGFVHGNARAAIASIKASPIRPPHAVAALLVQPWIAASAGDWDLALLSPSPGATDSLSQLMLFQRAQLLERRRRNDEADVAYKAVAGAPGAQPAIVLGYGEFLERRRRRDEAVAVYDAALAMQPTNPTLIAARARAGSGGRAPRLPTDRQGVVRGLLLASAYASQGGANEFAAVYTRLALNVEPDDGVRLQLARYLTQAGLDAAARNVLAEVAPSSRAEYAVARVLMGQSFGKDERPEDALVEFQRAFAAAPESPEVAFALAAQLVELKRNDEALALLTGPVLGAADPAGEVRFLRGAALEGAGRVAEAEAELQAALADQPDQPAFLNYLGYLWVDNGTRVEEGAALIARAHAADPEDGNIQDSLGWAQFRQGQFETAVQTLEEAVSKEPANAEINDHLGDAYWRVGRRREAGWQWNRVLTLDPDAERRAEVETKIADGLPAAASGPATGGGDL